MTCTVLVLLVWSCGGFSDVIENLGDGYVFLGEGPGFDIIYRGTPTDYGYTLDELVVYPDVSGFDFDDKHIIC